MDKIEVNGENTSPVYAAIKSVIPGNIKWNFEKVRTLICLPILAYEPLLYSGRSIFFSAYCHDVWFPISNAEVLVLRSQILVDKNGLAVQKYNSLVEPSAIEADIEALLAKDATTEAASAPSS